MFVEIDELKQGATDALDNISIRVDELQARIVDINIIHNYLQHDQELFAKYGGQISELFGKVNALTRIVDEMTLQLNDLAAGGYDNYPTIAISSFIMAWDMQATDSLDRITDDIEQLERYIEYFRAINEDVGIEVQYLSKPTVH